MARSSPHLQHFYVLPQPGCHLPRLHAVKEQRVTLQQRAKQAAAQPVRQALAQCQRQRHLCAGRGRKQQGSRLSKPRTSCSAWPDGEALRRQQFRAPRHALPAHPTCTARLMLLQM